MGAIQIQDTLLSVFGLIFMMLGVTSFLNKDLRKVPSEDIKAVLMFLTGLFLVGMGLTLSASNSGKGALASFQKATPFLGVLCAATVLALGVTTMINANKMRKNSDSTLVNWMPHMLFGFAYSLFSLYIVRSVVLP